MNPETFFKFRLIKIFEKVERELKIEEGFWF